MDLSMRRRHLVMRLGSFMTIPVYRAFGARFTSRMKPRAAPPLFLLTTTGHRTGKQRTVTLSYLEDEDGTPLTVGTHGGLPTEPAWVANLRANPEATIQIGREKRAVRAAFVPSGPAGALWARIVREYPLYEAALASADREVPIIRLESN